MTTARQQIDNLRDLCESYRALSEYDRTMFGEICGHYSQGSDFFDFEDDMGDYLRNEGCDEDYLDLLYREIGRPLKNMSDPSAKAMLEMLERLQRWCAVNGIGEGDE